MAEKLEKLEKKEVKRARGRPALPPEQQRARLIDAAERCFEGSRYSNVGIVDIVREAHMSTRTFYQFFESKEDLVVCLAETRADIFLDEMERLASEADNIVEAVDQLLRFFLLKIPIVVLELNLQAGSAGDQINAVLVRYREQIAMKMLGMVMAAANEEGLLDPDDMPEPWSIVLVLAGIEGLILRYHSEGRREELEALHEHIMGALRFLFPRHLVESQKIR
jgi:AcrR family transcriptional regulator